MQPNPIQSKTDLLSTQPQFTITNYSIGLCSSITSTGFYSCAAINIEFSRESGFFFLHLYIPSAALVVTSWVSFWLDPTNVPVRIALGVTVLLSSHVLTSGVNEILPPVSYIKAIDVWIFGCAVFILASLIEFAMVSYLFTTQQGRNISNTLELQELLNVCFLKYKRNLHFFKDDEEHERRVYVSNRKIPFYDDIRGAIEKDARILDRISSNLNEIYLILTNHVKFRNIVSSDILPFQHFLLA